MNYGLKYYFQKCVEHIVTHTVWAAFSGIGGAVLLNIPKLFSMLGKESERLADIANVFTVISLVWLFATVFVVVVAVILNKSAEGARKKDRTADGETVQSDPNGVQLQEATEEHALINEGKGDLHSEIPFRFKKVTISMKIASCTSIEYIMKYDGFATKENVEFFANQLSWSGTQYIETTLVSSNIEAHLEDNIGKRDHSPYTFKIVFDEDIAPNERIKFTTKTVLSDQDKCMLPLSSFCVKYPIDELMLTVSAPIGLLHTVRKKCYHDAGRQCGIFSSRSVEHQDVEGYRTFLFSQKNPTPWLFYVLEWIFSEQY